MKRRVICLLVICLLTMVTLGSSSSYASPEFYETTVWQNNEGGLYPHFVYGLCCTNSGTILAFCEGRLGSGDDDAHHILLKRSTDNGQTWGNNQYVVTSISGASYCNPVPVVDSSTGEIFLFYAENFSNSSTKLFYKSSSDDGISWSQATEVTSLFSGNSYGWTFHLPGPGHGIETSSGRLMIPVWHRKSISYPVSERNYGVSIIYSDDNGATWQAGGDAGTGFNMNESRIAELENGDILLSSRTFDYVRATSQSSNNGLTWSTPSYDYSLDNYNNCDSGLVVYTQRPTYCHNRLLISRPDSIDREKMTISISYDEGATWEHHKLITSDNSYYSDLVVLSDNSIGLLYGKGGNHTYLPSYVSFVRLNLECLSDGHDDLVNGPNYSVVEFPSDGIFECEDLDIVGSSNDTLGTYNDSGASGGTVLKYLSDQVGDYVSLNVPIPNAGQYNVKVRYREATNRAIIQLKIDGTNQGSAINPYNSAIDYGEHDLGNVTFDSTGDKVFRFEAVGKDAASTGYAMFPDSITITPLSLYYECEDLDIDSTSSDVLGTYDDSGASGGTVVKYLADEVGDYIAFKVPINISGTYHVKVGYRRATNRAKVQLFINGTSQGNVINPYSNIICYTSYDVGSITFNNTGEAIFRFEAVGKDPASTGYGIFPDVITLTN